MSVSIRQLAKSTGVKERALIQMLQSIRYEVESESSTIDNISAEHVVDEFKHQNGPNKTTKESNLSNRLKNLESYRPKRQPYRKASLIRTKEELVHYCDSIIHFLTSSKNIRMTKNENVYLYFLERQLGRIGAFSTKQQLYSARLNVPMSDFEQDVNSNLTGVPIVRANWRFLPNSEAINASDLIRKLREHFADCATPLSTFEEERIHEAFRFKPHQICIGTEEFLGYYAFVLNDGVNIFECPIYGNAAFVVQGNWAELSLFSKGELEEAGHRILHRGDWRTALLLAVHKARLTDR